MVCSLVDVLFPCLVCRLQYFKMIYQQLLQYCFLPHNSQRLRPTIHEIITSKIKTHAELVNSSRSGIGQAARPASAGLQFMKGRLQLPKQKRQNGISLSGTLLAVSPVSPVMAPAGKAQAAAKELLDSILDAVVRIFGELLSDCYCVLTISGF